VQGRLVQYGCEAYPDTWARQLAAVDEVAAGQSPVLLLGCHPPVVTVGRGTEMGNLLVPAGQSLTVDGESIPMPATFEAERGGDVTFHGPGQIVGYPILPLEAMDRKDLHQYMRDLEEVQIRALAEFGLIAGRNEGYTGVWIEDRKIASIGVAVRRWVSYHGFALNVSTDLRYFRLLNPCGLEASVMTSIEQELGPGIDRSAVEQALLSAFTDIFGISF
jgi:lipoate-protein ligase B